ncbi:hypothetical protein FDP41_007207 [Naegleria fowleri]|uniref:tRNA-binding domain-containing protein n=1 Tax=Naegleria fowleri TaxID=5763 RepID=A0A6A5BIH9_NAEFO|nr:uncharacterized protein FDP41_007207 [Naegleria fowleri]KAF0973820.1 hypothetical protein FDP41_007207 [Naegleria fowleri]
MMSNAFQNILGRQPHHLREALRTRNHHSSALPLLSWKTFSRKNSSLNGQMLHRFYSTEAGPSSFSETVSTTPSTTTEASNKQTSNSINIEDFMKVEIVVGQIVSAQFVKKSKKLICFRVNIGEQEPRQILSGIRTHYPSLDKNTTSAEEELNQLFVGQKVLVVKNLESKIMAGLESHGMILFATTETIENSGSELTATNENSITPVMPKDYERVKPGTRVC